MLDRIGSTFLVRPDERRQVVYFLLLFFLVGCGMAIGRASADALFFKRYGIEHLPLIYLFQGGLLFLVTTVYASYADRLAPERLLQPLLLFLALVLMGFWLLLSFYQWEGIYPLYYLLYEMTSEIVIVHCMLYIARNFDVMQAKRLTPLILGGWQVGTVIGGITLASIVHEIGVQQILLLWVGLLMVAAILVVMRHGSAGVSPYHRAGRKGGHPVKQAMDQLAHGVAFARRSDLLKAMSFALFFMVITFYVLCYSVNRVYTKTFTTEVELTQFFGILGATTGVVALLIQIFASNRLIRRFGVRNMNLFFPGMTLFGFSVLMMSFVLPAAILGSLIKDALMPAIRNPVRALFFNALPSSMQGRCHAISVGIVLPIALAVAGLALMLAQQIANVLYFLGIGMVTAIAYLFFSTRMNKAYVSSIISSLRQKLFVPDHNIVEALKSDAEQVIEVLARASKDEEPEIRFTAAKTMLELFPDKSGPVVLNVLADLNAPLKDQLLHLVAPVEPPQLRKYLWQELRQEDSHLRASALYLLFKSRDSEAKSVVATALKDGNPRMRAIGIYGVLCYPIADLMEEGMYRWREMFNSATKSNVLAALDLLSKWPNTKFTDSLTSLLVSKDERIQFAALQVLMVWPEHNISGLAEILQNCLSHHNYQLRIVALNLTTRLADQERNQLALQAIDDAHPEVRQAAALALFPAHEDNRNIVNWILRSNGTTRAQDAVLQLFVKRNPARHYFEEIAHYKAKEAFHMLQAQQLLKKQTTAGFKHPALGLFITVLFERCQQVLDQALIAAEQFEDQTTVGVIRAGMKSGDKRHMAGASEAVRYIEDKILAEYIVVVLESFTGEIRKIINTKTEFRDLAALWQWLEKRQDPWLASCAQQAKAALV